MNYFRPTFQFFKASKKVAELKGANPTQLEALIKQHQGPVDDASESGSSSGSVAGLVPGHNDLTDQVTLNQVDCLNQQNVKNVRNALKTDETFLESDVDEQLIISVPFNQVWKRNLQSRRFLFKIFFYVVDQNSPHIFVSVCRHV